jgi:hypothetical protein
MAGTPLDDDEDERDRRITNIFLLVAAALFIGRVSG